jgi:ergothioneine biosynthesis protein EgtB
MSLDVRRDRLRQWFQACRAATFTFADQVDDETFCCQTHPDFSPVGWHVGHIGYTEALWLLQACAKQPPICPDYHRLFAADGLPKTERVHLPSRAWLYDYLATIREHVLQYLQVAPLDEQERLWRWLLQHESQHNETMALLIQVKTWRGDRLPSSLCADLCAELSPPTPAMILIPAGEFEMGNVSLDALDNERPVHRGELPDFWIDRYPVTCGEYRQFIHANGYQNPHWWSPEGWRWLQQEGITHPLYWSDHAAWEHHPVCGVSAYEADAYAAFVGKRLPTEAEWEKAASWNPATQTRSLYPWGNDWPTTSHANHHLTWGHTTPVHAHPNGRSAYGCEDLLGNVWEWTTSQFSPYPGFSPYPYPGYSQTYFDGKHWVLRGGSWATLPWAMRSAFRNWYYPFVRQILAGFRCACSHPPDRI